MTAPCEQDTLGVNVMKQYIKRYLLFALIGLVSIAASFALVESGAVTVDASGSPAAFDSNGRLQPPTGYQGWALWARR
jgi:hypothetical protein